jgi:hypothetical protein
VSSWENLAHSGRAISMIKPYVITDKPNAPMLRIYDGTIAIPDM